MKTNSGKEWCSQFPTSNKISDLEPTFGTKVVKFLAACDAAGLSHSVAATRRPAQRAYLMHWSWMVARGALDPKKVPPLAGVDIIWDHTNAKEAAEEMVQGYQMKVCAVLDSLHIDGKAIDINFRWSVGPHIIKDANGHDIRLDSDPRNGDNPYLQAAGASYGVLKLKTDPPHWSATGH